MELGLRGRKALITGASRGIGRACTEILGVEGCDVVLVSRTAADLDAARPKITAQYNVAVRCFPLDLSDSKSVDNSPPSVPRLISSLTTPAQSRAARSPRSTRRAGAKPGI